jgi:hypothetical protein
VLPAEPAGRPNSSLEGTARRGKAIQTMEARHDERELDLPLTRVRRTSLTVAVEKPCGGDGVGGLRDGVGGGKYGLTRRPSLFVVKASPRVPQRSLFRCAPCGRPIHTSHPRSSHTPTSKHLHALASPPLARLSGATGKRCGYTKAGRVSETCLVGLVRFHAACRGGRKTNDVPCGVRHGVVTSPAALLGETRALSLGDANISLGDAKSSLGGRSGGGRGAVERRRADEEAGSPMVESPAVAKGAAAQHTNDDKENGAMNGATVLTRPSWLQRSAPAMHASVPVRASSVPTPWGDGHARCICICSETFPHTVPAV